MPLLNTKQYHFSWSAWHFQASRNPEFLIEKINAWKIFKFFQNKKAPMNNTELFAFLPSKLKDERGH